MLPTAITITASAGGPGTYTATVLFSDATKAPFVRVGDILEDKDGNQYTITTWSTFPSDFASGGVLTVDFITTDIAPATFGGFGNALIFTEGQQNIRPLVQTAGQIQSQTLNSGQNSLYDLTAIWFDSGSAANVLPGDHIMDSAGKIYVITITNSGATSVTVQELTLEGISPSLGDATLFRPTGNYDFFQGTPVSDPARTVVRNKDDFNIDAALTSLQDQINAGGSGGSSSITATNNTGSTILKGVPVRLNDFGDIEEVDVSIEAEALSVVGITNEDINDGASGTIVTAGKVEDITNGASFNDLMYISKTGVLTNVLPSIGVGSFVEGDFVITMGIISKNEADPLNKDVVVNIQIIGQL